MFDRRRVIAVAAVTVIASGAIAMGVMAHEGHAHRGPAPPPRAITVPEAGATLPMDDMGGRPVVSVMIGGRGPYRFILDTGAHITVVDSSLDAELDLPTAAGVRAAPAGGGAAPKVVNVPKLEMNGVVVEDLVAAVMPMARVLIGDNAPRGVLSASAFPGYLLTFDYPRREIRFGRGDLGKPDDRSVFEYRAEDPFPTVPIRVAKHETRVHLDTGSGYGLMLPTRWIETLPLATQLTAAGHVRTHSDEQAVRKARVDGKIELGRFVLPGTEVMFSDVKPGDIEPIGNIGYEILRDFVVTLDSKQRRVRFVRASADVPMQHHH